MSNTETSSLLPSFKRLSRARAVVRPPIPSNLTVIPGEFSLLASLPRELHLHIISFLRFEDVTRLRRTCRHYYYYFTRDRITKQFCRNGLPTPHLRGCCASCFRRSDFTMVLDEVHWQSPWRSMCFECFRVERSPAYYDRRKSTRKSTKITFADGESGHVCSYCGWPVYRERMHITCYQNAKKSYDRFLKAKGRDFLNAVVIMPLLTVICSEGPFSIYLRCVVKMADEEDRPNPQLFWYPYIAMGPVLVLLWLLLVIQSIYGMQINWNDKNAVEGGVFVVTYFSVRV
ncbi:hypothetical protein F5Y00DRAFT_267791 [Daldinia vernicosa]|uniref:uncharacterized protein n=1 Tax=Daldinia vernicosa TaxID=114800 RepID=UPI002008CB21|nr:uncharacterized protein F5Y00DRAFT_267791 [Daldinia vernicosa]KAI0843818.1 hypothetical protein F5Y00DRAFT_267791 [Daldinia vernicosa]